MGQLLGEVVSASILFSTSAVVSGSIALVGNTLYWVDEQGECSD